MRAISSEVSLSSVKVAAHTSKFMPMFQTRADVSTWIRSGSGFEVLRPTFKSLAVLQVSGYVHRTDYRMIFVYAQGFDFHVRLGQEIFENSSPYQRGIVSNVSDGALLSECFSQ